MSLNLAMDHHNHQEHGHGHGPGFGDPNARPEQWMDDQHSNYQPQHQSSVNEYTGMQYANMPIQPMHVGSSMPHVRSTHQQLQPLIMPQTQPQWPSMLTSQSTYNQSILHSATLPTPSTAQTPIATPLSAPPATGRQSVPRRTLTDADRRRMCQYAEDHPTVKQTEIGAMFGVERSTVSKVLRQKEKYLYQDDGRTSPQRKLKGKFPDVERALYNWVQGQMKQGLPTTDSQIKERYRVFMATMGSPDGPPKPLTGTWLEKFKLKSGIRSRKGSLAEESEAASGTQTPIKMSSASPPKAAGKKLPNIASSSKRKKPNDDSNLPEEVEIVPYRSISNESLSTAFAAQANFATGPGSPQPPPTFLEASSTFVSPEQSKCSSTSGGLHRPRSQTFPMLGIEQYIPTPSSEAYNTPKYMTTGMMDATSESHGAHISTIMQPPPVPSMADASHMLLTSSAMTDPSYFQLAMQAHPPPQSILQSSPVTPGSALGTPILMTPGTYPPVEEAKRAMEVVMQYFQSQTQRSQITAEEFIVMAQLLERLKLQATQSPLVSHARSGEMPGGMHRIPSSGFQPRSMSE